MHRFRIAGVLTAVIILVACLPENCLACPNCKDSLAGAAGESMNVARGYALSILIMLGMPFTLASCFGIYVWREMRRLRREGRAAAPHPTMRPLP